MSFHAPSECGAQNSQPAQSEPPLAVRGIQYVSVPLKEPSCHHARNFRTLRDSSRQAAVA